MRTIHICIMLRIYDHFDHHFHITQQEHQYHNNITYMYDRKTKLTINLDGFLMDQSRSRKG